MTVTVDAKDLARTRKAPDKSQRTTHPHAVDTCSTAAQRDPACPHSRRVAGSCTSSTSATIDTPGHAAPMRRASTSSADPRTVTSTSRSQSAMTDSHDRAVSAHAPDRSRVGFGCTRPTPCGAHTHDRPTRMPERATMADPGSPRSSRGWSSGGSTDTWTSCVCTESREDFRCPPGTTRSGTDTPARDRKVTRVRVAGTCPGARSGRTLGSGALTATTPRFPP